MTLCVSLAIACSDSTSRQTVNLFEPQQYGEWTPDAEDPPECVEGSPVAVIHALHPQRGEVFAEASGYLEAVPLDTIELDALSSRDGDPQTPDPGDISRVEWRIVERPNGSTSGLENTDRMQSSIWMQLAGRYVVELDVWNEQGLKSCEPARLAIEAIADQDIHIQLVWHTPADAGETDRLGSDVDLHLLHPNAHGQWDDNRWDCYWRNLEPDWGRFQDPSDDPSLDIDDIDGAGPENINLDNPEPGAVYQVGVDYFSDHGFGPSLATVRIYIGGELAFESPRRELIDGEFWHVAEIAWPSGVVTIPDF
jgi:hypothetical protein